MVNAPHSGSELRFPVVCVVASAGGRGALVELLRHLPTRDTHLSLVLIYDGGPEEGPLFELAAQNSPLPVTELRPAARLLPGCVQVLPRHVQVTLAGGIVEITPRGEGGPSSPADVFLRSLASELGERAIGVALSGAGSDGALGLKDVKAEGGVTFAEDPRTAERPALPRSAIAAGGVDFILSVEEIAAGLARMGRPGYTLAPSLAQGPSLGADPDLGKLFGLLRASTGVDFSHYKKSTLKRRIQRRMTLHRLATLQEYLDHLQADPAEVEELYQDLLIRVTAFFRDPGAFAALKTHVFPVLMHRRPPDSPVRIWVPGCSTGEEVYSLAISLLEFLEADAEDHLIQIFGTDLSEAAIHWARDGIYVESISIDVSPSRLRRFFVRVQDGFQVSKSVRDLCIFSRHNAAVDPPLSKLDLISCRNLMIYLEPSLQRRLLHTFHQSLKPTGFLLLGSSESIGAMPDRFGVVDRTHRIFCKRAAPEATYPPAAGASDLSSEPAAASERPSAAVGLGMETVRREADALVIARYTPAGVVVDEDMQILQFRGKTGPYLEPAPGDASLHLFRMARPGLLLGLREAVDASRRSGAMARRRQIKLKQGDRLRSVDIEVWPLKAQLARGRCFLVLFTEPAATAPEQGDLDAARSDPARQLELVQLRRELESTREYLQSIIDELEATNEELQCVNEELLANNDELRQANEALDAEREGLRSPLEELTAADGALPRGDKARRFTDSALRSLGAPARAGRELAVATDTMPAVFEVLCHPILLLDGELRVRAVTRRYCELFMISLRDIEGRPLSTIEASWNTPPLEQRLRDVLHRSAALVDFRFEALIAHAGRKTLSLSAFRLETGPGELPALLLVFDDRTGADKDESAPPGLQRAHRTGSV
ncbi:chemotaxis protein CheR [Sorangium cellulosum]|uniref:protein-glutamate O-methyltransferase n=1 Tax=Sorangium cellulosum TaxID=56 RepID=A0A2L0ENH1_SORCE|nr:chemotaxis protein CheR [Sorangium cellulosum]